MVSFGQEVELLRYEALMLKERIVGAGGIYRVVGEPAHTTWLGWLGVEPNLQGQGLGSILLHRLFDIAVNHNAQQLKVYTPAHLAEYAKCRTVYAHLGFLRSPEHDFTYQVEGQEVLEHMLIKPLLPHNHVDLSSASLKP